MDGKRWIPSGHELEIERLSETELLERHLHFINECLKYDMWKDYSHTYEYRMREALGRELRIRMAAE
jgi:hypothetical protein